MANTLAFQLYSLKDYEGGFEAGFQAVKSLGIDTIEPWSGAVSTCAISSCATLPTAAVAF